MNEFSVRNVRLREILETDLPLFFENQLNATANHMAAFTAKDPGDRTAFDAHWRKIMSDETVTNRTIVCGETVIGNVLCFEQFGQTEISYWLGKDYWGKGIATEALTQFLNHIQTRRPLYARAAQDNLASIRVLQKCGFQICGEDKGFSNARGRDVEEFIFKKNE
ncbi:GNAT family N-acetyltransferase [Tumebacillus sp. ITR2]|uniref:GNAT family N-acetyltransferase n=1 Tax=Tumebacillus amylolyticus TaxID=2801339 RepID=A0ABS1J737_9BACL|nr:GNAT family N-acetyltransferase [Tumebacillus amylolyticus]MBL0386078.1 GNAT family N-acetyltransferase [Tumebacillus amylolyticus]